MKTDNKAIGSIGLIPPAQSHARASNTEIEVGYWIGVPYWGNGYIPEAVRALQQHAFNDLNCTAKDIRIYPYWNRLQMHLEYLLRNFYRGMQSQT